MGFSHQYSFVQTVLRAYCLHLDLSLYSSHLTSRESTPGIQEIGGPKGCLDVLETLSGIETRIVPLIACPSLLCVLPSYLYKVDFNNIHQSTHRSSVFSAGL